jgi:signal transduction histidine kinase
VRLRFASQELQLEVEDHGSGFPVVRPRQGIGLVAMRERAELLGGEIAFDRPADGGTLVKLTIPRHTLETHA